MADIHKRVGRVMPHTASDGTEYPQSFWYLSFLAVDAEAKTARIVFSAHASTDLYEADADRLQSGRTQKEYLIGPDQYDAVVLPLAAAILPNTWQVALTTLDTPDGNGDLASFFANSQSVPLPFAPPADPPPPQESPTP